MHLPEMRRNVDFMAAIRDNKIPVRINDSENTFLVESFCIDEEKNFGTISASCGASRTTFDFNDDFQLSMEEIA